MCPNGGINGKSFVILLYTGLRLLGAFTDLNEASSLSYANDVIDIYSNSWGPCDEGCVDGPMRLTELALKIGAQKVRRPWLDSAIIYIQNLHPIRLNYEQ